MPPHDPKLFPPDETGFAPHDLTDGRKPFDWSSRWSREAIKSMRVEASYLMILLAVGVAVLAREFNTLPRGQEPLPLVDFSQIAWSAGLIGGTAFGIKWF